MDLTKINAYHALMIKHISRVKSLVLKHDLPNTIFTIHFQEKYAHIVHSNK